MAKKANKRNVVAYMEQYFDLHPFCVTRIVDEVKVIVSCGTFNSCSKSVTDYYNNCSSKGFAPTLLTIEDHKKAETERFHRLQKEGAYPQTWEMWQTFVDGFKYNNQ